MKVNYNRLKELNVEATHGINQDNQLSCYWLIQNGLDKYLCNETISNEYVNFLTHLGVLEPDSQEEKSIVKPFNFMGNDGPQGN